MPVVIRLSRKGSHKKPFYRIVATDKQYPRDGRHLEILGTFDPRKEGGIFKVDQERLDYWIGKGALPSETIRRLMNKQTRAAGAGAAEKSA